jgi:hypothetical protein
MRVWKCIESEQLLRFRAPLEMTVDKHGEANTEEQKKKEKTERRGQKKNGARKEMVKWRTVHGHEPFRE